MRSTSLPIRIILLSALLTLPGGCGGGGSPAAPAAPAAPPPPTAANEMNITVNGSLCSGATSASYPNKPCVSVTICDPNTSACQTISDILLDTGSYGLRVFRGTGALTLPLQQVTNGSGALAECVQFADLSSIWGPVMLANVKLGGEPAVQIPIQVIDASFGGIPASSGCTNADALPAVAGYAGILGVGNRAEDNGVYYACNGATCVPTGAPLASQVVNPVARLLRDNNGVIVDLPIVSPGGVVAVNGSLILGIDTEPNNASTGAASFATDSTGTFTTTYGGRSFSSFLDTGSNGIFFNSQGLLPACSNANTWYCPPATTTLTAATPNGPLAFQVGNYDNLINTSSNVFVELGGTSSFGFDWGLPFYFGRHVFIGIVDKKSVKLGTGPYLAF